ncbi:hypothetical protein ABFS82_09G059300 [Erythranthe guttata]
MGTNRQGYHLLWPDLPIFSQLQFTAPFTRKSRGFQAYLIIRERFGTLVLEFSPQPRLGGSDKTSFFFFKPPIRSRSPLLTGSRLISLPLLTQMFQFAKFEKSKECRLATELGYGFPIGDPWITDGISPWPFASESVLPSQCPGIRPMHYFRSCTRLLRIG